MAQESVTLFDIADRTGWEAATTGSLPGLTWGHAAGLAENGLAPQLAVVEAGGARMLLPFHQRAFRGCVDIATLPGLSGALIVPDSAAPLRLWSDFARGEGWVSGYLQLSVLNSARFAGPDRIAEHNSLFVFDLAEWDIATSVGVNMRRSMHLGTRLGAEFLSNPAALAVDFAELYSQTRARSGGKPEFSNKALAKWFASSEVLTFAAKFAGELQAAQLGRRAGDWAELHLAGATEAGRPLQAWLIWQALEALRGQGLRWINIGGYGATGDGLHKMKSRMGAIEYPLRAVHQIYDHATFSRLCGEARADPSTAYFPPYRAQPV